MGRCERPSPRVIRATVPAPTLRPKKSSPEPAPNLARSPSISANEFHPFVEERPSLLVGRDQPVKVLMTEFIDGHCFDRAQERRLVPSAHAGDERGVFHPAASMAPAGACTMVSTG